MYCSRCGKEFSEGTQFCPYCGQSAVAVPSSYPNANEGRYNVCAIVGFVLSLVSLFLSFGGVLPLAALIVSAVGIKQTKERNEKGSGHAIAGVVIGAVCLIFALIITIFFGSLLSLAARMG